MWKKVVAPTALVGICWMLVSGGTSYVLTRLDETQTELLNQNRYVIQANGALQESLWRLQAVLLEAAEHLQQGGNLRERFRVEARQIENTFDRALTRVRTNASTPEENELVDVIAHRYSLYRATSREQLSRNDLSPEEAARSVDAAMRLAKDVAQPCEELSQVAQGLTNEAFQRRDRIRTRVNLVRVAFMIVGPAIGILLGLWVARGLHHSISEINVILRDASGELQHEVGLVEIKPAGAADGLPALQQQVQFVSGRIKQVIEELQSTRREAIRAERLAAVGELAAGIAHEVRNPLTSVKLLIQAVERNQAADSDDKQRLQIVQQEIARIETTMQELLDYARPPKLHRVRHDIRNTLRRALNLAAGRAQQSNIHIDEQLGENPVVVDADPEKLQQVFINLLLNAIEEMPSGGTLYVGIDAGGPAANGAHAPSKEPTLRIVFRDTGCGIRAEVLERLFQPFVTSKERGIGLGLAISRQIMHEHEGQLSACNPPPGGAMFVVELPYVRAVSPGRPASAAASATSGAGNVQETSDCEADREAIKAASD